MIRREFLTKSAIAAGGLAIDCAYGQTAPCPLEWVGVTNAPCVTGPAPDWFLNMADNTWSSPVTNTIASVGGTNNNICNAWTGGSVSQEHGELILAANGGHNDYDGNEVYACQLRQDSPAWIRLTDPSSTSGGTDATNSIGNYGDGNPRSTHSWSHQTFGNGKVWKVQTGMYPSGNQSSAVYSFDRDAAGNGPFPLSAAAAPWTYHGLGVSASGLSWGSSIDWQSSCTNYDKDTKKIWSLCTFTVNNPRYPFFSVDTVTGAITEYPSANNDSFPDGSWLKRATGAIVDGVWIIIAPNYGSGRILLLDLSNPNGGFTFKTTSGSPAGYFPSTGCGTVYHNASNALLVYDDSLGRNLRKLTIPADKFNGSWVWSEVVGSGETPSGQADDFQGVYTKFNIIEDMGNGQSALVVVLNVGGPVFVYKLPVSGV